MKLRSLAAGAALAAAGCGSDPGPPPPVPALFEATCNDQVLGLCRTYVSGWSASSLASEQTMCGGAGTWSTSAACPAANRIGSCATTQSGAVLKVSYYPAFGSDAAALETSCVGMGGTWTAG
jgi:hypothetical protein